MTAFAHFISGAAFVCLIGCALNGMPLTALVLAAMIAVFQANERMARREK